MTEQAGALAGWTGKGERVLVVAAAEANWSFVGCLLENRWSLRGQLHTKPFQEGLRMYNTYSYDTYILTHTRMTHTCMTHTRMTQHTVVPISER